MGQARSRNGGEQVPAESAGPDYIPSFELIPLEEGESDAALFDFGPDLAKPDGAPVAALPPWMDEEQAQQPDTRRSRRRAAAAVPRARRHRRQESSENAPIVPAQAPAARDDAELEDTRDVDVTAVIAAEAAAERTRQAKARAGREVPAQRPVDPPVMIISAGAVPAQAAPEPQAAPAAPAVPAARATPQPTSAQPSRPAPPVPVAVPAADDEPSAGGRKWVAALLVAAAIAGGAIAWNVSGGTTTTVTSTVPLAGSAQAARDWLNVNLGEKSSVLAPASVAEGLREVDFAKDRVIGYPDVPSDPGAIPDWRCCNVLVATAPSGVRVTSGMPPALQSAYEQSRLLATFEAGGTVTEVRQVLDGSPEAVAEALQTEQDARIAAGKEIAGIDRIKLSKSAKADLTAGRVDSRVMLALVGLSRLVEVSVLDFPIDPADKAAGAPARGMRIDELGGKKVLDGNVESDTAYDFLDAQVAPYRPLDVELINEDSGSILELTYDAPGTLGLITPRGEDE